ncbi:MAG: hypothetical protein ACRCZF_03835 [Gemmataceae bacterium]
MFVTLILGFLMFPTVTPREVKWSVKQVEAAVPKVIAEPIAKELSATELQLSDGEELRGVFRFRKSLVSRATKAQHTTGLRAEDLVSGEVVGIVEWKTIWTDYRNKEIAAGVYVLRFAQQPEVGDHKDTAPNPEFLLLTPATADMTIDGLEPKALQQLSRKATGGDHPAVMLLPSPAKTAANRQVRSWDANTDVLRVELSVNSMDGQSTLPLELVIRGKSASR